METSRSNQKPADTVPWYETTGRLLLLSGIVGFAIAIIQSFTIFHDIDNGSIPAISFLFIILGLAFAFPDMLQDETGGLSTMRVVVLVTILVFAVITIKIAWQLKTFDEWRIDHTWIYILGLAFGGKAFQKYSEVDASKNEHEPNKDKK